MLKSFFQGVLVAITLLLLAVLCLPIFFIFLWLTDTTKSLADLLYLPDILTGIVILFIALFFGRLVLVLLKSIKA
jgi:hypothetical protein